MNGEALVYPRGAVAEPLAPGETKEALVSVPLVDSGTLYPLYNGSLLPPGEWARAESYIWYSQGGHKGESHLAHGWLADTGMPSRFIHAAGGGRPFITNKYDYRRLRLSIGEARRLAPYNSATSLQVAVGVLSGIVWALENPAAGIVEAEDMDFARHLELCGPYVGPLVGEYTDWTPLQGRGALFPEAVDAGDPWQFSNVRVA